MSRAHINSKLNIENLLSHKNVLINAWFPMESNKNDIVNNYTPIIDAATLVPGMGILVDSSDQLYYHKNIINLNNGTFICDAITSQVAQDRYLFYQWDTTGSGSSIFGLWMLANGLIRFRRGDTIIESTKSFNDGGWHNYCITWDKDSKLYLYVDGTLQASALSGTFTDVGGRHNERMPLGHRGWTYNDYQWNGYVSNVRWYFGILDHSQIMGSTMSPFLGYDSEGGGCT